jgi:hypothetical protein
MRAFQHIGLQILAARLSVLGIIRATVLVLLDGGPPACCSPSASC